MGHESKDCDLDEDEMCNLEHRSRFNSKMCIPPLRRRPSSPENSHSPGNSESHIPHREHERHNVLHGESPNHNQCSSQHSLFPWGPHINTYSQNISDVLHSPRAHFPHATNFGFTDYWANLRPSPPRPTTVRNHEIHNDDSPAKLSPSTSSMGQAPPSTDNNIIEGGFFITKPPPASLNSDDEHSLVRQVTQVNLKRKADDSRDSPLPKRNKAHESISPRHAERNQRTKLFLDHEISPMLKGSDSPRQYSYSHSNRSPTDLKKPYNGYDLIFNVGTSDKKHHRRSTAAHRTRRNLFPSSESSAMLIMPSNSSDLSQGSGWSPPATDPQ